MMSINTFPEPQPDSASYPHNQREKLPNNLVNFPTYFVFVRSQVASLQFLAKGTCGKSLSLFMFSNQLQEVINVKQVEMFVIQEHLFETNFILGIEIYVYILAMKIIYQDSKLCNLFRENFHLKRFKENKQIHQ